MVPATEQCTKLSLKWSNPSKTDIRGTEDTFFNQETLSCPTGVRFRRVPCTVTFTVLAIIGSFLPNSDYQHEQESQQEEWNVAPHTVEGVDDAKRMNTLVVVEAGILITTDVDKLHVIKINDKKLKQLKKILSQLKSY